ncbi:methylglyoxal synthase [Leptospira congkakensis]|uniref:Methylglyoxal synthase n=2 Tax=Leptospira congkakensis TaxID=2484932 RepID=A0A4Z1AEI1_9LEPT|nr:methylglyoxal synthase [Leptospira congkakensis]TGL90421.1 methylglyoxal synthase [Leptospira congkakensis]TGL91428.1 methylglyoxal synthase [Leptospira congkakensis]TGL99053.1 methylglyoxal synthase [Leptospira congkakensis]
MEITKKIVLIAHDNRKEDLLDWVKYNRGTLSKHHLSATGTTGKLIHEQIGLPVFRFISGPLGGDQQIGSKIVEDGIDFMVFFWDPLSAQPHDPDVKALLRIAVLYNIPMACNRSSADFLISSPLMETEYNRQLIDYGSRLPAKA